MRAFFNASKSLERNRQYNRLIRRVSPSLKEQVVTHYQAWVRRVPYLTDVSSLQNSVLFLFLFLFLFRFLFLFSPTRSIILRPRLLFIDDLTGILCFMFSHPLTDSLVPMVVLMGVPPSLTPRQAPPSP